MIIINTNQHNGYVKGNSIFYCREILRGKFAGKYAASENSLIEFPEIFQNLSYETADMSALDFEPDYTPPASNGKGIVIPEKFQWIFPVKVGGFTLELKEKDGIKYAEESFLGWTAFVREIRKPENVQYRATILPVWNYGLTEAERIDL